MPQPPLLLYWPTQDQPSWRDFQQNSLPVIANCIPNLNGGNFVIIKHPMQHRWHPRHQLPPERTNLYQISLTDLTKLDLRLSLFTATSITNTKSLKDRCPHNLVLPLMQCVCSTSFLSGLWCISCWIFTHTQLMCVKDTYVSLINFFSCLFWGVLGDFTCFWALSWGMQKENVYSNFTTWPH